MTWIEYLLNAAQKSKWNLELWVRYLNKVIQRDKILLSKTDIDYLMSSEELTSFQRVFLELALEIHHIIRNADLCRNSSGIIYRTESTASAVFFLYFRFFVLPDLHRNTDHIISLFFQKICRYR